MNSSDEKKVKDNSALLNCGLCAVTQGVGKVSYFAIPTTKMMFSRAALEASDLGLF